MPAAYVDAGVPLVRLGFVELYRDREGAIVAVPAIPSHMAPEYLHATVNGDVVVVTIKKRALNG